MQHTAGPADRQSRRDGAAYRRNAITGLTAEDKELAQRLHAVRNFGATIRVSEYHLTNACNIRCQGCWFFEFGHDTKVRELKDLSALDRFLEMEKARRITAALLIGGEPTLVPDRVRSFTRRLKYITLSSNGLKKLPADPDFANVAVMLTLFGGGQLDDELRAIKPGGKRFTGLFDRALENYRNDPRANFVYAVTTRGIEHIEDTVRRIRDNGNRVTINFYSEYDTNSPIKKDGEKALLEECLRVKRLYADTVTSHEAHIRGVITGMTEWGSFGYHSCPSISISHPAHAERIKNGNPTLPLFNTYNADFSSVEFCCTSGHCDGCRDSQAVYSWLMVNMDHALSSTEALWEWVLMAESYWRQFIWSPYHPSRLGKASAATTPEARVPGPMPADQIPALV
jgi:MoaA/NifB/PqqE/SkfB family radical SAM enzyme